MKFWPFYVVLAVLSAIRLLVILSSILSATGLKNFWDQIISSPGRSPGRAIVLPPALASTLVLAAALAKSLMLKFFM